MAHRLGIVRHAGGSEVLVIKEAYFTRAPGGAAIKVLGDSRFAEIFVPDNDGERICDFTAEHFTLVGLCKSGLGPTCVTPGAVYRRDGTEAEIGLVAKEVHDDQAR